MVSVSPMVLWIFGPSKSLWLHKLAPWTCQILKPSKLLQVVSEVSCKTRQPLIGVWVCRSVWGIAHINPCAATVIYYCANLRTVAALDSWTWNELIHYHNSLRSSAHVTEPESSTRVCYHPSSYLWAYKEVCSIYCRSSDIISVASYTDLINKCNPGGT